MNNNMLKFNLDELNLIVHELKISAQSSRECEETFKNKYHDDDVAEHYRNRAETVEKLIHKIETATLA